ncbi:MAG: dihydropteroate synthase [Lachnospiraceae bacterium]|jgi:dihydropteroate synthase|nr:dihydropteroate synthase [Lachnospiraceae bacterium]
MRIGQRDFRTKGHAYVMGILNVTPDSFSDGGKYNDLDQALYHVEKMITDGMDIVDVGGESTRPGYTQISAQEEIERVTPVIEAIKSRFNVPISLDTYKSEVAKAGIAAGVDMINDIWGLKYDDNMAQVIAESGLPCCLSHNRKEMKYKNLIEEMFWDLEASLELASSKGIAYDKIILDPGIGYGKSYENNLEIIDNLQKFHSLGYPLLLGASRKSVVGMGLDLPVNDRMEGTLVTTVYGVQRGVMFVRVHDVKENARAVKMTEAIRYGYRN